MTDDAALPLSAFGRARVDSDTGAAYLDDSDTVYVHPGGFGDRIQVLDAQGEFVRDATLRETEALIQRDDWKPYTSTTVLFDVESDNCV